MASSVNGSPGVEMGMSGDAIPVPEVEPEDPAEVNKYVGATDSTEPCKMLRGRPFCCHGDEIWARRGDPVAYRLV